MGAALGGIIGTALVAVIAGLFALKQARTVADQQEKAHQNTAAMELVKVQIDGWDRLNESHQAEIVRLTETVARLRAELEAIRLERSLDDSHD